MHVVSIYNNKGGVGKSTLTVCLAEFLRSGFEKRVLVVDMDGQASSSCSLLGKRQLTDTISAGKTIGRLAAEVLQSRRIPTLAKYLVTRPSVNAKGSPLEELSLLVPDKQVMIDLEEAMSEKDVLKLRTLMRPAFEKDFDYVLIDMPSHVDRRNKLILAGLVMSDFVLIPIEPSQLSLAALPDTFDFIAHARKVGNNGSPQILGMVRNKTDRREEQYRSKFPAILAAVKSGDLPPMFENILPDTPKLETATDDSIDFRTLKEKFDTYYDNVRLLARELHQRCESFKPTKNPDPKLSGGFFAGILMGFRKKLRNGRTTVDRSKVLERL